MVEVVKMEKEVLQIALDVNQKGFISMDKRHDVMLSALATNTWRWSSGVILNFLCMTKSGTNKKVMGWNNREVLGHQSTNSSK